MKSKVFAWVFGAAISAVAATAAQAGTLDDVKQKGFVQCGVSQGLTGFLEPRLQQQLDRHGRRFLPRRGRCDLQRSAPR